MIKFRRTTMQQKNNLLLLNLVFALKVIAVTKCIVMYA